MAEMQMEQPNLPRFEAPREQADPPAVIIRVLMRAILRRRPDRIILGEVRGGSVDLLQALTTGHAWSSQRSKPTLRARFSSCVTQSGVDVPDHPPPYRIVDAIHRCCIRALSRDAREGAHEPRGDMTCRT
jgi:Flp pilus assembly CpaF family ATPase